MNEKIENLVKSQPDITKLVDEIYTLRRDTNTLLESQSAARKQPDTTPPASENPLEGLLEDEYVDEQQKSVLDNLPSRVAQRNTARAKSYNQSRSTRRTHMTTTQSYIRNRRYAESSGSDSDDVDLREFTDIRNDTPEQEQAIPFFAMKRGLSTKD